MIWNSFGSFVRKCNRAEVIPSTMQSSTPMPWWIRGRKSACSIRCRMSCRSSGSRSLDNRIQCCWSNSDRRRSRSSGEPEKVVPTLVNWIIGAAPKRCGFTPCALLRCSWHFDESALVAQTEPKAHRNLADASAELLKLYCPAATAEEASGLATCRSTKESFRKVPTRQR